MIKDLATSRGKRDLGSEHHPQTKEPASEGGLYKDAMDALLNEFSLTQIY
jgi:hypothetical protein